MLRKQTALYMVKRPHVFYPRISDELMHINESYESFVTNIFNGNRWGHYICLSAICHMWNIPIGVVTPYRSSIVNMFHNKEKCVVVVIANGWPSEGKDITHYSATARIDNDDKKLPNANQKGEKLIPGNYRNPIKARSDALEFTVEKNKFLLVFYYNEIESDIDSLKKQIKSMNNKVQHLEKIQQKVKDDLHLLGVQVKDVAKKKQRTTNVSTTTRNGINNNSRRPTSWCRDS